MMVVRTGLIAKSSHILRDSDITHRIDEALALFKTNNNDYMIPTAKLVFACVWKRMIVEGLTGIRRVNMSTEPDMHCS